MGLQEHALALNLDAEPLFRNIKPDLRSLIAYLVARTRERSITLNQTKGVLSRSVR